MVIADHLQAEGDPRGDLIVLDHAERRGLLIDAAAIEQLLLLAAEYSFPRATPEPPPLALRIVANRTYETRHAGTRYRLHVGEDGRWWHLTIDPESLTPRTLLLPRLPIDLREPDLCFQVLSDAIRARTPLDGDLWFDFDGVLMPRYDGGPLRCYHLPVEYFVPRGHMRNRFGLAARDYHRWHAIWQRLRAGHSPEDEF
jgi:hypothetical protein